MRGPRMTTQTVPRPAARPPTPTPPPGAGPGRRPRLGRLRDDTAAQPARRAAVAPPTGNLALLHPLDAAARLTPARAAGHRGRFVVHGAGRRRAAGAAPARRGAAVSRRHALRRRRLD